MKKGGGKGKGGGFERDIAKKISLWWSNNESKDLCWRSASSGGRATQSKTKNKAYHGDLTAIDDSIKLLFNRFSFELKFYKNFCIEDIIHHGIDNVVLKWWKQCLRSAGLSKRQPILIIKRNNRKELLLFSKEIYYIICDNYSLFKKPPRCLFIGDKIGIVELDEFLSLVDLKTLKTWLRVNAKNS